MVKLSDAANIVRAGSSVVSNTDGAVTPKEK